VLALACLDLLGLPYSMLLGVGYIDPSAGPFWADPSGVRDSTSALQLAINVAMEYNMIVYLPAGRVGD